MVVTKNAELFFPHLLNYTMVLRLSIAEIPGQRINLIMNEAHALCKNIHLTATTNEVAERQ